MHGMDNFKKMFVRGDECLWAGTNPEFFTVGGAGAGAKSF